MQNYKFNEKGPKQLILKPFFLVFCFQLEVNYWISFKKTPNEFVFDEVLASVILLLNRKLAKPVLRGLE